MEIRMIHKTDARDFLHLMRQIAKETPFMLCEPDEIIMTVEQQQEQIQFMPSQENYLVLVAEYNKQLVGYLVGTRGEFKRNMHNLYLAVGILQTFTGQGIGTQLFIAMEHWARQRGITRLDLTVMAHNQAGIALYKKRGFEIEGIKRQSMFIDGSYFDEYIMGKLLI